jgi:stage II sporulation protein D
VDGAIGRRRRRWGGAGAALAAAAVLAACARAPQRQPSKASGGATPGARRVEGRGGALDESGRIVRVALAVGARTARLAATSEWRLYTEGGEVLARVPDGAEWTVEREGPRLRAVAADGRATAWREGPLIARSVSLGGLLAHGGKRYRGELWAHAADGAVTVVNRLPVEAYLRGVVPLELNLFGPGETAALEAQAVAARSYTYSRLAEFQPRAAAVRQAARPFDLRATVNDQVYGGADVERRESDRAVRTTEGLVLRYEGSVVSAPYHSACGGSTAEPQELWQSPAEPYLRRVSDRIPGTADRHYCDAAPRFRWTREYDAVTLDAVLARYLRAYARGRGTTPDGARDGPVGAARALAVESRTPSGRAATLAVTTDAGRFTLHGNDIRFALRSAGGEILASTYFSVDAAAAGDGRLARVTLRGHGNGHGVGMCQWGAVGRARAGHDFRTILRAYFPGTAVEPAE